PRGAGIDLQTRTAIGRFNSATPPPWRYRLAMADRRGPVHVTAPVEFSQRISNQGVRRWENLRAHLPLTDVPDGNHVLLVSLDTAYPELRVYRPLRPRPGVLANARTMLLRSEELAMETRYLVHTIRRAPQTWITIQ